MVQTWAEVLGVDSSRPSLEDDVASLVMALRSEIKLARDRLDAIGVPTQLTSPAFERLSHVASPGLLHSTWNNHRGNIQSPEVRKIFEWVAWALRDDDEADMTPEDMRQLMTELDSLEVALQDAEMAEYLRDFIKRQIDAIRSALQMYGVNGVQPIQDALQKVVGAYATQQKPLAQAYETAEPDAKSVFQRTNGMIERVAKVADNLSKIKKAGEDVFAVGSVVSSLVLPYVSTMINGS